MWLIYAEYLRFLRGLTQNSCTTQRRRFPLFNRIAANSHSVHLSERCRWPGSFESQHGVGVLDSSPMGYESIFGRPGSLTATFFGFKAK